MAINNRSFFIVPAAALLLAVSGCSSAGTSAGTGAGSSSAAGGTSSMAMTASPGTATAPAGGSSASATPATASDTIHIKGFAYQGPDSVASGAMVTVMNMDSAAHTVTADEGSAFDVTVKPGESVTFTAPTAPGTYKYHCTYHGNMHGTLVVK
ncbi:cupredoxin domain-containing protein [Paenarthrobacter sp. PH39-S1]|uniref:cupredoxin domain-containing protein n=1 Tax=Paenarthrobacter sp. PH39-S1 TaxID=3046204 RepID=UPI0024B940D6|nr:cupredoxin domain-containing protein [Paenarthrobacter sp. PH39-S1]MDJ0355261.1 cupredoxin domain-containing protein [Paenarthrobacter sp. PH39-S1]